MTTPSFYILHGDDEFAIAEELQSLKAKLGDPATASLNVTVLDGRTTTLAEIRSAADAMPFLSDKRLVIVEGLLTRFLSRGGSDDDGEEEAAPASLTEFRDALLDYLPSVPPTTRLIFVERRRLPERNKFLNLVANSQGRGFAKRFDLPHEKELPGWIMKRAKSAGGQFAPEAAAALASAVGAEPRLLDSEIEKLLIYTDRARPVEVADVELLTPYAGEVNVFNMVDAIGQRNGRMAVQLLNRLLDQPSQYPLAVLGMIARQFRLLLIAKELLAEGAGQSQLPSLMGVHPYVAGKVAEQSRMFSLEELEAIFRKLLDVDLAVKTSQMDGRLALETFVADPAGWTSNQSLSPNQK